MGQTVESNFVTKTDSGGAEASPIIGPYRTIVFDLDGTLADTAPDLTTSVNVVLAQMGRALLTIAQVRIMMGDGVRMLVERAITATGGYSEELVAEYFPLFLTHYQAQLAKHSRAWPGV